MLRQNVENTSNEQDEIELSRRSFFGRLAVGAVLSIAMPGVVHAAKSAAVKADKNSRLAQANKGAVRLPKNSAVHAEKLASHQVKGKAPNVVAGKAVRPALSNVKAAGPRLAPNGRFARANVAPATHQSHAVIVDRRGRTIAAAHGGGHSPVERRGLHQARVRDVYNGGKRQVMHTASNYTHRDHGYGRVQTIAPPQPVYRDTLIEPVQESLFLSDRGRFATHRALAFQNPHTGDRLNLTYFEKGRYLSDALDEISYLLRDYRTGDVYPIDPELLDQLHDLKQMLGLNQAFDVVCGYRSPITNARLHAENHGVANNSFHMHGRAVDIRVERFDIRRIRNAALAMHRGGVGYYPESNFIHLDTGTFRTWSL